MVATEYSPTEQRTRRRRARISQTELARQFDTPVSKSTISRYENGHRGLPFEFTPDDYEKALHRARMAKGVSK